VRSEVLGLTASFSAVVAGRTRLGYVGNTGYSLNADVASWISKTDGGGGGGIAFTRGRLRVAFSDDDIVLAAREQSPGTISIVGCAGATCKCSDAASACRKVLSDDDPVAITAHGGNAYWSLADGSIKQCAVTGCGGNPLALATTSAKADAIAVDDTGVYVAYGLSLGHVPLGGGAVTELGAMPSAVTALAIDGSTIYAGHAGGVVACAKTGCLSGPTTFASSSAAVSNVKTNAAGVWWQAGQAVFRCAKGSSCATPTSVTASGTESFAVDDQFVYIATRKSIYSLGL